VCIGLLTLATDWITASCLLTFAPSSTFGELEIAFLPSFLPFFFLIFFLRPPESLDDDDSADEDDGEDEEEDGDDDDAEADADDAEENCGSLSSGAAKIFFTLLPSSAFSSTSFSSSSTSQSPNTASRSSTVAPTSSCVLGSDLSAMLTPVIAFFFVLFISDFFFCGDKYLLPLYIPYRQFVSSSNGQLYLT
jgi:hypothetical protein